MGRHAVSVTALNAPHREIAVAASGRHLWVENRSALARCRAPYRHPSSLARNPQPGGCGSAP